jgi:site-specific recombinase XerD
VAKSIRSSTLETRANRLKLPITSKPVYVKIGPSMSLGYRRNRTAGRWVLRLADGKGGMTTQSIAHADDHDESNGQTILTFYQAQDTARRLADQPTILKPLTVQEAVDNYLVVLKSKNTHTEYDTRLRLQKHFLPHFKDKLVSSLTKTLLEKWLSGLVDKDNERASKDTANRILTMVKALLNYAMSDSANQLRDDAWRFVRPFKSVGQPRSIRYTTEEVMRIVANAPDQSSSNLINAAFLCGTRYGEMITATVASVNLDARRWHVVGKTGSRSIMLQQSAVEFFRELVNGKSAGDVLFTMENGQPWKASDQTRPFKAALKAAGLPEDGSMYALRHSYISASIEGGTPLNLIADNCGTSVRMITQTYAHILGEKQRAFIEAGAPSMTAQWAGK